MNSLNRVTFDPTKIFGPQRSLGSTPKFHNDLGVPEIRIGVKKFECTGTSPPHDHPHIYLDMGEKDAILCPYCSTCFQFAPQPESVGGNHS